MKNINLKKMLNDRQELTHIINQLGQEQYEIEEFMFYYEKNKRQGVLLKAQDTKTGDMKEIIIDTIDGEPNSDQFKEVTHGNGSDCDKRIILYTLDNPGHTQNDYRHEREMMKGFIKVNNDCGHDTYLIKVSSAADKTYQYELEISPNDKKYTSIRKLPSKLEFEQAVFKVFYNQTDFFGGYEHEEHMEGIDGWFAGTYWWFDVYGISFMYPVWNEDGLFAQAKSASKEGLATLETIKESHIDNLKKMFVNREVSFEKDLQGDITMSIKLWDKSFSFFTRASLEDKEKIAEFLRILGHQIFECWEYCSCLDFKESDNEYFEKYLTIPEDVFSELEKDLATK